MLVPYDSDTQFLQELLEAITEANPSLLPPSGCSNICTATYTLLTYNSAELLLEFDSQVNPGEKVLIKFGIELSSDIPPLPDELREWPKGVQDTEWDDPPKKSYNA